MILEDIDTSKDGKLSLEEYMDDIHKQLTGGGHEEDKATLQSRKAVEKAKFEAADSNKDGILDASELPGLFYPDTHEGVLHVSTKDAMLSKDANSDGRLSKEEFFGPDTVGGLVVER